VARGYLRTDVHFFTGFHKSTPAIVGPPAPDANKPRAANSTPPEYTNAVDTFPFPISLKELKHGQDRYMIYCVVCHDPLGNGEGKIVERGYTRPPSYHIDRLRTVPVGHIFDVITNGYGSMPDYKQQVPPRDRWAIVAYIRALQLSQHFPVKDLPADMRAEWKAATGGEQPR
jgi:mono/diheme cytochrome c family protein